MNNNQIERESYSRSSYRMVQSTRARGAEYGLDVPYLHYPLPTERSTGLGLKIMLTFSALLVVAGLGLLIWALVQLFVPAISSLGNSDWDSNVQKLPILGLIGLITSLSSLLIWIIIVAVPVLGAAMIWGGLKYLFTLLRICRLSMPEKAVGFYLSSVKKNVLLYAIVFTVITVVLFIFVPTPVVGIIGLIVSVYLWAVFAVLQLERHRALPAFQALPTEQQTDFTAHSQALKLAHSRHNARKASRAVTAYRHGKLNLIMSLLGDFVDAREVYNNLKDNEAVRPVATGLARRAFYQLLTFTLGVIGGLAIIYGLMAAFAEVILLQVILLIFGGALALFGILILMPTTLNFAIKQLKLNGHYLGWVAIVLTLLALLAAIGMAVLVLGTINL